MKKLILILAVLTIGLSLSAQKPSPEDPILKRTYPIDSCLYFQLPVNFLVKFRNTLGNGNTSLGVQFISTDPSFPIYVGKGKFLIDSDEFPLTGWGWENNQTGKATIVVPDNALAAASGDPDANLDFPVLLNAFLQEVEGIPISPPFPVYFQLIDLMEQ